MTKLKGVTKHEVSQLWNVSNSTLQINTDPKVNVPKDVNKCQEVKVPRYNIKDENKVCVKHYCTWRATCISYVLVILSHKIFFKLFNILTYVKHGM